MHSQDLEMKNSVGKRSAPSCENLRVTRKVEVEKHKIFVSVHSSARWVKQVWPGELTFSIPTFLMKALRAMLTYIIKQELFLMLIFCLIYSFDQVSVSIQ